VDAEYTIDELARHVGLPSSTIRLYQQRGILPRPRRQGRTAFYDAGHVARIELVGRLQERGFSLASIADLVAEWEQGRDLDAVLGLERHVGSVRAIEPLRMTIAELAARFPTIELSTDDLRRAAELGLVDVDGEHVVVTTPAFLDVGAELVARGFPLGEVLDEAATLQAATNGIAERFAATFERNVWRPFVEAGLPAERFTEVTAALASLGPLAERIVAASLRRSLDAAAARLLAEEAYRRTATD
jgi:DNA-binding transcriptional MerR regulator